MMCVTDNQKKEQTLIAQIGYTHGKEAKAEIDRGISFYADLFMKTSKQTWPQVQDTALKFDTLIRERWPRYYKELRGKRMSHCSVRYH
jgi:hypothetical protein